MLSFKRLFYRLFSKIYEILNRYFKVVSLFYWSEFYNKKSNYNFGDAFSPIIVNFISKKNVKTNLPDINDKYLSKLIFLNLKRFSTNKTGRIVGLGSILHLANNRDVIWGTGIIPMRVKASFPENLDVRAVRGPLTRDFLLERKIKCPEVYGDPGIFCKNVYQGLLKENFKERELGIITQWRDAGHKDFKKFETIDSRNFPIDIAKFIISSEFIISTSLHGIIFSESLGIPCRWLFSEEYMSGIYESSFKYEDYFQGTGRMKESSGSSISECINLGSHKVFNIETYKDNLMKSFPSDLIN
tara:strand:- start:1740 stop:2639 length:900 start_codon:yes stop_codon:yes gene_type:complete